MAKVERACRDPDELAPFVLDSVRELHSASEKGAGSYGIVQEVSIDGVSYVAKKVHSLLVKQTSAEEKRAILSKFHQECVMLSKLKHPNIVHFVGVHYAGKNRELMLIMEELNCNLAQFLDHQTAERISIPLSIKLSILLDVSYGLLYLHTQFPRPVIHRDLTAYNVLLTSDLQGKIADLGVSKLVSLEQDRADTVAPGNVAYMPPEALKSHPKYEKSLDVFSFGHLAIYVVTQIPPVVQEVTTAEILAEGGNTSLQVLKRKPSLDEVRKNNCLYSLVIRCLQDYPQDRPTTIDLNSALKDLSIRHPKTPDDVMECCYKELADELAERRRDAGVWEQALSLSVAETEKLHLEQESLRATIQRLELIEDEYDKLKDDHQQLRESYKGLRQLTETNTQLQREVQKMKDEAVVVVMSPKQEGKRGSTSSGETEACGPSSDTSLYNDLSQSNTPDDDSLASDSVMWMSDHWTRNCCGCSEKFSLVFRRHHCRSCGRIFCNRCCGFMISLDTAITQTPVRVCGACFAKRTRKRGSANNSALEISKGIDESQTEAAGVVTTDNGGGND